VVAFYIVSQKERPTFGLL